MFPKLSKTKLYSWNCFEVEGGTPFCSGNKIGGKQTQTNDLRVLVMTLRPRSYLCQLLPDYSSLFNPHGLFTKIYCEAEGRIPTQDKAWEEAESPYTEILSAYTLLCTQEVLKRVEADSIPTYNVLELLYQHTSYSTVCSFYCWYVSFSLAWDDSSLWSSFVFF